MESSALQQFLTLTAIWAGAASAVFWWASSYFSTTVVKTLRDLDGENGDLAIKIAEDHTIIYRSRRTARLNAFAAFLAGLAIAAQALALYLGN